MACLDFLGLTSWSQEGDSTICRWRPAVWAVSPCGECLQVLQPVRGLRQGCCTLTKQALHLTSHVFYVVGQAAFPYCHTLSLHCIFHWYDVITLLSFMIGRCCDDGCIAVHDADHGVVHGAIRVLIMVRSWSCICLRHVGIAAWFAVLTPEDHACRAWLYASVESMPENCGSSVDGYRPTVSPSGKSCEATALTVSVSVPMPNIPPL